MTLCQASRAICFSARIWHCSRRSSLSQPNAICSVWSTWLDVMNAMRELSQNEYALNDVQHNFFGLLQRLRVYAAQQP